MSKEITKEEVIFHKKQAIKKVNNLLELYINHSDPKYLKKRIYCLFGLKVSRITLEKKLHSIQKSCFHINVVML